jgi:hypothetical protein
MAPWTVTRRGPARSWLVVVCACLVAFVGVVLLSLTFVSPGLDKIRFALAAVGCSVLGGFVVAVVRRRR